MRKSREERKYVHIRFWVEKAEGKSLVRRSKRRWRNEVKRNSKVEGGKNVVWVRVIQDREE